MRELRVTLETVTPALNVRMWYVINQRKVFGTKNAILLV